MSVRNLDHNLNAALFCVCEFSETDPSHDDQLADADSCAFNESSKPAAECDTFCDFKQFEGSPTNDELSSNSDTSSESLMQKSVRSYLELFAKLVDTIIVGDVELFLNQFVVQNSEGDNTESKQVSRVSPPNITRVTVEAFGIACQLLVDLSALPVGHSATVCPSSMSSGSYVVMYWYSILFANFKHVALEWLTMR
jgi:hypothetical protein